MPDCAGERGLAIEADLPGLSPAISTGPQDASRINIHEDYEVAYWTKKFGVTKAEFEAAVSKAGASADAVARELGKAHA